MEQVLVKKNLPQLQYELAEVLVLEPLQKEKGLYKVNLPQEERKPLKKQLWKLFNRGKYNAKYLEELVSLDEVKRVGFYRNYGVF